MARLLLETGDAVLLEDGSAVLLDYPLYAMLDEDVASDADYILSADDPVNDTCEIKFDTPATTPSVYTDHVAEYRIVEDSGSGTLTVSWYCGSTLIASWTHAWSPSVPATTYKQTLTEEQAARITDHTDNRLRFVANKD